jgi:ATP-binding cassette subfamily C protein EexD
MIRLLRRCGRGVVLLGALSLIVAAMQFVVPLYMMAVYNRILQTQSIETLQLVSMIAAVLLLVLGIAEIARSRVLALMATRISQYLNEDVYKAILSSPSSQLGNALRQAGKDPKNPQQDAEVARTQSLTDLRQVSAFVASGALNSFYDALLAPIFIAALFLLHPLLGWLGVVATLVILSLALLGEVLARKANEKIGVFEGRAQSRIERSLGQFDAVASMGLAPKLYAKWEKDRQAAIELGLKNQSVVGMISGAARAVRLIVQIAVLGGGAWLVLTTDSFLAGAIIAGSIILSRALAPIDQSISIWRRFVQARQGARRLMAVMDAVDTQPKHGRAPAPETRLFLKKVTLGFAQQRIPMLQAADLTIEAGQVIGIHGPNGSGKTTLLRALAGLHQPQSGSIQLGATPVGSFGDEDRHGLFGYLPQDIQLLPGTVAENISRFQLDETGLDPVFEVAERVKATGVIQALPNGFSSEIIDGTLSAGQTQMIGLARALFGDPLLALLDEPTANLDAEGHNTVLDILRQRGDSGKLTFFVSHDLELLKLADKVLYIAPGQAKFGPSSEILLYLAQLQDSATKALVARTESGKANQ